MSLPLTLFADDHICVVGTDLPCSDQISINRNKLKNNNNNCDCDEHPQL